MPKKKEEALPEEVKAAPVEEEQKAPVEEELVFDAQEGGDDDDFADAHPYVPTPAPEEKPAEEETAPTPEVDPQEEEVPLTEEEEPEEIQDRKELPQEPDLEYDDASLSSIEEARKEWHHHNKISGRIKFAYSTLILLGILAGWLIPTLTMRGQGGTTPLLIGLGCAVGGIILLAVIGLIRQKRGKTVIRTYFNKYYDALNAYTLGSLGIDDIQGDVDCKITNEEFLEGGAFDRVASVGSRDNITFTYRGMDCALADTAGSVDGGKALQTIFVGKYLRAHNNVKVNEDGLLIYFMGNERSLPPEKMKNLHLTERTKRYKIYGSASDKKILTKKIRDGLARIRTDKLLVDVTLVIKPGRTYWYLGYEDDIMVLPNDKPFDSRFIKEYKWQIADVLEISRMLNE